MSANLTNAVRKVLLEISSYTQRKYVSALKLLMVHDFGILCKYLLDNLKKSNLQICQVCVHKILRTLKKLLLK